jgi:hypothetical protein
MRNLFRFAAVTGLLVGLVPVALADFTPPIDGAGYYGGQAYLDQAASASWSDGGEFSMVSAGSPGLLLSTDAYSSLAKDPTGFRTFCIERDEYVYPQQSVQLWVSTAFVDGSQPGSHAWRGGTNTNLGDDLNVETAYLYTQFATGNLPGYAYSGPVNGLTRSDTANVLQEVIWKYEGEISDLDLSGDKLTLANQWINLAGSSGWTGIGNVRVLQVYAGDPVGGDLRQDQLYLMVPAPAAVLLGAVGLGLVIWLKHRTHHE